MSNSLLFGIIVSKHIELGACSFSCGAHDCIDLVNGSEIGDAVSLHVLIGGHQLALDHVGEHFFQRAGLSMA
jgi:hypothetical protein